ncbi:MAG: SPOR domain-containing protein [Prolixibacteraceae bacterium]|nr:SPOR domain-containing protein [Prolixibacteraceae bacterium]MBN2772866.1 SPOR domain-containing protein [Prolixibacteraceae bacterium]
MMKKVLVLLLATFLSYGIQAQSALIEEAPEQDSLPEIISKLHLQQDARLTDMVKWQIENNESKNGIDGWRVNIFTSSQNDAYEKAREVKKRFLSKYPDIPVHLLFNAPDFIVRVGDFRTRNEALKLRKEIQRMYPKAFEVWGKINFPEIEEKKDIIRNE